MTARQVLAVLSQRVAMRRYSLSVRKFSLVAGMTAGAVDVIWAAAMLCWQDEGELVDASQEPDDALVGVVGDDETGGHWGYKASAPPGSCVCPEIGGEAGGLPSASTRE
jgi:hypothetical protein